MCAFSRFLFELIFKKIKNSFLIDIVPKKRLCPPYFRRQSQELFLLSAMEIGFDQCENLFLIVADISAQSTVVE